MRRFAWLMSLVWILLGAGCELSEEEDSSSGGSGSSCSSDACAKGPGGVLSGYSGPEGTWVGTPDVTNPPPTSPTPATPSSPSPGSGYDEDEDR